MATQTGFYWLLSTVKTFIPGELSFKNLHGSLLDDFSIQQVHYKNASLDIYIKNIVLDWQSSKLLEGKLTIQSFDIKEIIVRTPNKVSAHVHFSGTIGKVSYYTGVMSAETSTIPENIPGKILFKGSFEGTEKKATFRSKITGSGIVYEKNRIPTQTIDIGIEWKKDKLSATLFWPMDRTKRIDGHFLIQPFSGLSYLEKKRLSGTIHLLVSRLDFLNAFELPIKKIQGKLESTITLAGTLAKPTFEGLTQLRASAFIPELKLRLNAIDIALKANAKKMNLMGKITSGKNSLNITGESLAPFTEKITATVIGKNFTVINNHEYQIHISPDLKVQWTPDKTMLRGSIDIPYARIEPIEFSSTLELPSDVVFVSDEDEKAPLNVDSEINITLGKDVLVNTHGVTGKLAGSVVVIDQNNTPTKGVGKINILSGKFEAYKQKLTIDKGQATFDDSPIDNPMLSIRATRTFKTTSSLSSGEIDLEESNDITVGVQVTDSAQNPHISLFSIPATFSQSDILSFLVLGHPVSQVGSAADGALLLQVLSGMNMGNVENNQITQQLQQSLGLDTLKVETGSQYNSSDDEMISSPSLVIGKKLAPRLFLDYSMGLLQGTNLLKIRYFLTPKWIVQTETDGANQGVDFLYRFTRE